MARPTFVTTAKADAYLWGGKGRGMKIVSKAAQSISR